MKRKLVLVTGILVTVACTMSGTYAYYQDSVTVSNHISTGDVNIGIQEYEKDGDSEKFYQGPAEDLLPGNFPARLIVVCAICKLYKIIKLKLQMISQSVCTKWISSNHLLENSCKHCDPIKKIPKRKKFLMNI